MSCPMTALGWQQYQGEPFRDKVGKALWGDKWKDVQVGGKDADKVDVVIWAAVPSIHVENAITVPGRPFIRIIRKDNLHDPDDGNRYLKTNRFKKVYILKKGAEIEGSAIHAAGNKDVWPENVARFTPAEMETAWREVEKTIQRDEVLVIHFTSISSAQLILGEGSNGLRAAKAGQGGGGLSVVYVDSSGDAASSGGGGAASLPSPAAVPTDPRDPQGRLRRDFDKIDKDGNGSLDKGELFDAYMGSGPLAGKKSQDEVAAMFDVLDANGDGKITFEEYVNYGYFIEKGGDPEVLKRFFSS